MIKRDIDLAMELCFNIVRNRVFNSDAAWQVTALKRLGGELDSLVMCNSDWPETEVFSDDSQESQLGH